MLSLEGRELESESGILDSNGLVTARQEPNESEDRQEKSWHVPIGSFSGIGTSRASQQLCKYNDADNSYTVKPFVPGDSHSYCTNNQISPPYRLPSFA